MKSPGYILLLIIVLSIPFFTSAQSNIVSKSFLLGKYSYTKDTSFIKVGKAYANKMVYIKKDAYTDYIKMYNAALKDHIRLSIISGTRSFYGQRTIWQHKWNKVESAKIHDPELKVKKVLTWISMPGTSRHHWGTDIDMVSVEPTFYEKAEGKKIYEWLSKNASKYGFYQPFNANRKVGYKEEKWHWSYLPLAKIYLKEYLKQVNYSDITGFSGSAEAQKIDVFKDWVLAINPVCK